MTYNNKGRDMYLGYDQYDNHYSLCTHPRKELCEQLGSSHVSKMYRDRKDGNAYHVGYIIRGHWVEVFGLEGVVFATKR